ncbi:MAG: hypothetical protein IPL26_07755 [Leptospiraceae bacterium]|nr:hypothetical protein [Leptospiraceae bacterium]
MSSSQKKSPYLVSPVSLETARKTKEAAKMLRNNPTDKNMPEKALRAIYNISEESMNFYFIRPLEILKLGTISRSVVNMGVNAGLGVLNTFGKQLISHLSKEQLVQLADIIDSVLVELDIDEEILNK